MNRVPEILVLKIPYYVLIEPVYDVLITEVIVNCLNIKVTNKFVSIKFQVIREVA